MRHPQQNVFYYNNKEKAAIKLATALHMSHERVAANATSAMSSNDIAVRSMSSDVAVWKYPVGNRSKTQQQK